METPTVLGWHHLSHNPHHVNQLGESQASLKNWGGGVLEAVVQQCG